MVTVVQTSHSQGLWSLLEQLTVLCTDSYDPPLDNCHVALEHSAAIIQLHHADLVRTQNGRFNLAYESWSLAQVNRA